MRRSLIVLVLVLVCLVAGGCGDGAPDAPAVLADGAYEVLAVAADPAALPSGGAETRVDRAAVVIGGDVVTVHRIREPIRGGALQVSC